MAKHTDPASNVGCFSLFCRMIRSYIPVSFALLIQGAILLICLCPAALALKSGLAPLPLYLLASVILLIFFALPFHVSFGCAMKAFAFSGHFSVKNACSLAGYAGKMRLGLFTAARALIWFVPLAAACVYGYVWVKGASNFTVIFVQLDTLGKMLMPEGGLADGVFAIAAAAIGLLGLGLLGTSLASPLRYALTGKGLRNDRAANRTRLHGRTFYRICTLVINLLLCMPGALVLYFQLRSAYFSNNFFDFVTYVLSLDTLLPVLGFSLLPYLPFVPVRRMITSAFLFGKEGAPDA